MKNIKKILALSLAFLLASSNVTPVLAAYGTTAGDYWQESMGIWSLPLVESTIVKEQGTTPSNGTPSDPETSKPGGGGSNSSGGIVGIATAGAALLKDVPYKITSEDELLELFPDGAFRKIVFEAVGMARIMP